MIRGGMVGGVQLDPMGFLMRALSQNFAALGDEVQLSATMDLMHFHRLPNEHIDTLRSRFAALCGRAAVDGNLRITVPHMAATLLRACEVNEQQLIHLLQPTQQQQQQQQQEEER